MTPLAPQTYTPRSSAFRQYMAIGDVRRRPLARNGVWTEDWGAKETILALRGHCRGSLTSTHIIFVTSIRTIVLV